MTQNLCKKMSILSETNYQLKEEEAIVVQEYSNFISYCQKSTLQS